jgi:hypothetical protein
MTASTGVDGGDHGATTGSLRAEVVSIGDELTTGQRLDTNSQWLSRELGLLGVPVAFHTTVTDSLEDGISAFRIARERADVIGAHLLIDSRPGGGTAVRVVAGIAASRSTTRPSLPMGRS